MTDKDSAMFTFEEHVESMTVDQLGRHAKRLGRWLAVQRAKGITPTPLQRLHVEETLRECGRWIVDSQ